jgi:sterol desaturase/sphingolipid hydroxylase (fatty acid hydroxylase superfamily)
VVGGPGGPASNDLADLARWFIRRPTPRLMAGFLAAAVVGRATEGKPRRSDAAVAAAMVAAQPLTEFVIHTRLLHRRPTRWRGRTIDPVAAHDHRIHHADPKDLSWVFVPLPTLLIGFGAAAAGACIPGADRRLTSTAAVTGGALLAAYEWSHYLMHTGYRPKTGWFRSRFRTHRLHHYRNEKYWFGVTTHLADQAFGTMPVPGEVPRSETARSLPAEV